MSRDKILIVLILVVFFLSKLPFILNYHAVFWDEAVYLGMGKALWSGGSIGLWEPIRPFGLPYLLGLIWKLGLPLIQASQLMVTLFAISTLLLTYLVAKSLFNKFTALLSILILSSSPLLFRHASEIMTGVPSTALALAAVYFFINKKNAAAGIFASTAFMFRFPQGFVIVAMLFSVLILQFRSKKLMIGPFAQLLLPFLIILLPFVVLNVYLYHNHTSSFIIAAFRPLILGSFHQSNPVYALGTNSFLANALYYPLQLISQNPVLTFSLIGIAVFMYALKKEHRGSILLILLLLFLAYFTAITNKQIRFALVFLPFIAIFAAHGICALLSYSRRRSSAIATATVALVALTASFSAIAIMKEDVKYYRQIPVSEPAVYSEFHKYFLRNGSPILTTDPTASAFVDRKFIPYYDNPSAALKIYRENRNKVAAVVYTPHFFPCEYYGEECQQQKNELFSMVTAENTIVFNKTYGGRNYLIFSVS